MKKYVFLTFAVSGIGGTQIYVRNKILFLKHYGWSVNVICTEPGDDICVKELKDFGGNVIPELMKNPYVFDKKQRESILDRMAEIVGIIDEEIVIESNFVQVNLWGELLAKKLKAKHFAYLIQEDYSLSDLRYMRFYDFKYRRGELAGNTEFALTQLFEGYREVPSDKKGELLAVCYNTIEECESEHEECITGADFHIGSIGRINKSFVLPMVRDIIKFVKKYEDKSFRLVFFGGSPKKQDVEDIFDAVKGIRNLSVYITGAIFPVPKHLLDKIDVFISAAGAARTSSDAGYMTISIDVNDYEPIGILGYTTEDIVHRNPELPHESTEEILESILIRHEYDGITPKVKVSSPDYMEVFKTHMAYLKDSVDLKEYYDISLLKPKLLTRLGYKVLGQKQAEKFYVYIKKIIGR